MGLATGPEDPVNATLKSVLQRALSPTIQENLFTTVSKLSFLRIPALAFAPENVFNNKADFKVLLPNMAGGLISAKGPGANGPALGDA